jgi:hypothetical protein
MGRSVERASSCQHRPPRASRLHARPVSGLSRLGNPHELEARTPETDRLPAFAERRQWHMIRPDSITVAGAAPALDESAPASRLLARIDERTRASTSRERAACPGISHAVKLGGMIALTSKESAIARPRINAELVCYASVAPLAAGLLGVGLLPGYEERELAQRAAIAYGAVLLSFVGAVHFGLALAGRLAFSTLRIAGATLPVLVGAAAAVLGGQHALALLVVGFGVFWLYEHRSAGPELPAEYLSLRRNLSLATCVLLAVTMILSESAGLR